MIKVAASLLAADPLRYGEEVKRAEAAGADWLHYDVMDGSYVPNLSFGPGILKAVASASAMPVDVHLMIVQPERYVEAMAEAGARVITVHAEAALHLDALLRRIRALHCLAGVSLNPATSPECLRYVLGEFDLALVMSVNPGFGGQAFLPSAIRKVAQIREMLDQAGAQAEIEVDGGVNAENGRALRQAGASVLVTGTALFCAPDARAFVEAMKK